MSDTAGWKPGQDTQAVATARLQGQDPDKIHCPTWGVIGNLGDSICYAGVPAKVEAVQAELRRRVAVADLPVRVIAPNFAGGISDGQRNGTPEMRYSLIGRETSNDGVCLHLEGSDVRGGDRRGRLRQAAGRDAGRDPGAQRARGDHVRRVDPPGHRLPDRRAD